MMTRVKTQVADWDGPVGHGDHWFTDLQDFIETEWDDVAPGESVTLECGETCVVSLSEQAKGIESFTEDLLERLGEKYCTWCEDDVSDYISQKDVDAFKVKLSELIDEMFASCSWREYNTTDKEIVVTSDFVDAFYNHTKGKFE